MVSMTQPRKHRRRTTAQPHNDGTRPGRTGGRTGEAATATGGTKDAEDAATRRSPRRKAAAEAGRLLAIAAMSIVAAAVIGLMALVLVAAVVPALGTFVGTVFGDTSRLGPESQTVLFYGPTAVLCIIVTYLVALLIRAVARAWSVPVSSLWRRTMLYGALERKPPSGDGRPAGTKGTLPRWLGWLAMRAVTLIGAPLAAMAAIYLVAVDVMPLLGDAVHYIMRIDARLTTQGLYVYWYIPYLLLSAAFLAGLWWLSRGLLHLVRALDAHARAGMARNAHRRRGGEGKEDVR